MGQESRQKLQCFQEHEDGDDVGDEEEEEEEEDEALSDVDSDSGKPLNSTAFMYNCPSLRHFSLETTLHFLPELLINVPPHERPPLL